MLTIAEMHRGIRMGLQQVDARFADGFQPQEVDFYINRAIQQYVKTQYTALKQSGDIQEFSMENLRTLIVHTTFTTFTDSDRIPQAKQVTLPSSNPSYEYFVHAHVEYSSPGSPSPEPELKTCQLVGYSSLGKYLPTQTNRVPWFEQIPILIYENTVHILREKAEDELDSFNFIYLRPPAKVDKEASVDCDLPGHTHMDIVSIVVDLMRNDVTQGVYQDQ